MGSFFMNGAIAWAAAGLVSIPIIIHLINRRRFRQIDWAAMEFLLQALRRNRRRVRIEHLILLLLRISLMLLLGLALARPVLSEGGLEWLAGVFRSEEKVFILDDSRSTMQRHAGRSVFEREVEALTNALDRLADQGGDDRVSILRGSRHRSPLVRRVRIDTERAARLSRRLSTLSPTDGRLPLASALESIQEAMVSASGDSGPPRPLAISILTDMRRSDWTGAGGGPDAALATALTRISKNEAAPVRIIVVDVGNEDTANVAVTSVTLPGGSAVRRIPTEFNVELRNFGPRTARGLRLGLRYSSASRALSDAPGWIDVMGPPVGPLDSGQSASYSIPCTFRNTGPHAVRIELGGSGDGLGQDDSYPIAVDVVDSNHVLLVNGEPASDPFEGETDFLEAALAPSGDLGSGILPQVVVEDNLPRGGLTPYAAVFICNLFSVPEDFLLLLKSYVENGGVLVTFLGDQIDAGLYNRRLGPPVENATGAAAIGLLPARIAALESEPQNPPSLSPDFDHPYFRSLRDVGEAFGFVHFRQYYRLEPTPTAQVVARFSDTDESPAIVEHAFGKGRVILFASSADWEWSDWPRSPTYLVLVQDLVASLVKARTAGAQHAAGGPLEVPVDIARYGLEARFRGPDYPAVAERTLTASPASSPVSSSDRPQPAAGTEVSAAGAGEFRFVIEDTFRAGHYGVLLKTKTGEEEWRLYAVRGDPAESNLRRITSAQLKRLYPDAELTVVKSTSGFSDVGRGRFEIADLLLWMFLGVLFVEGYFAWWFAHHKRATNEQ